MSTGLELERIWRTGWLFAAHTAELPHAGDRTVFDVGDDSALIVRGEDGELRAFHNVCRHRGSKRLVDAAIASFAGAPADPFIRCPYHQWAYRLDDSLAACGGMDRMEGFETSAHGLGPVECAEVGGLVFVRFEAPPADGHRWAATPTFYELAEPLLPQGLQRAKVALLRRPIWSAPAGKSCGRTTASAGIVTSDTRST